MEDPALALPFVLVAQLLGLYFSLALGRTPDNPFPDSEVNRVVQGVNIHPLEEEAMSVFLGVDGGGTKTALCLVNREGRILARARAPCCYYFAEGIELVGRVLRQGVDEVCRQAGSRRRRSSTPSSAYQGTARSAATFPRSTPRRVGSLATAATPATTTWSAGGLARWAAPTASTLSAGPGP